MATTIHLITELLYREPLREKLLEAGFEPRISKIREDEKHFHESSNQMFIVQAHLWPNFEPMLNNSAFVVMFGTPSWFYCWFKAISKHTSAYVTPFDSLDIFTSSLEQIIQTGNHFLSDTMGKLIHKDKKERQELLLDTNLTSYLTPSELEVLALVGEKYTTSEIAHKRFRSIHTVKTQRKKIRQKMNAINGERLAVFAGRKVYALKTLLSIEKHAKMLEKLCENTS